MKTERLMLILLILLLTSAQAGGATVSWDNVGDGLWSESANWSLDIVPGTADDVVINYGTGTITADTTATIKTLTLGGSNKLTVSSTGKLTASSAEPLKVFVTSTWGYGNLGGWADAGGQTGLAAGDNICQARATAAGLAGTYKAWLSDSSTDAYCHIQGYTGKISADCGQGSLPVAAGPWVRTNDGHPFADTIDRLINNGEVFAPVRYDETGSLPNSYSYFTGTLVDGTGSPGYNCSNWTSIGSTDYAQVAAPNGATGYWTDQGTGGCDNTVGLLCFQTGTGGPLPAMTPPALSKKVFVTSTTYDGALGGLSGADTICQTRAAAGGVPNAAKFKAWLSSSTTNAIDRFSENSWYRLDGVKVADSKAALIVASTTPLFTAISYTETGVYVGNNTFVWTGTDASGIKTANNCNNWASNTAVTGMMGITNTTNNLWTSWYDENCNVYRALYCFEDN
jgi:hypothetical protein